MPLFVDVTTSRASLQMEPSISVTSRPTYHVYIGAAGGLSLRRYWVDRKTTLQIELAANIP